MADTFPPAGPSKAPAVALTIAGSDSSGGAGIQADLKTFAAFGVYGTSVITALTAQNTLGVTGVMKVAPDFIAAQFDAVASDLTIHAIKTGMLADAATVATVAGLLRRVPATHVVVDPVMVATSGDRLVDTSAIETIRSALLPLATVITPNLPEAAALLDTSVAASEAEMLSQARRLLAFGSRAVLLKGGHGNGAEAVDLLVSEKLSVRLAQPRIQTKNTHGTGCTLAAAIAAGLARGDELELAVRSAKNYVHRALQSASHWRLGSGHGPVDHGVDDRGSQAARPGTRN